MSTRYEINAPLEAEQLAALFDTSGIRRPTTDLARIAQMIKHANLTITAWDDERLVGVARALTDFSWCCYLSDLAVDQAYQHAGIGKELIARVRTEAGEKTALILLSAPEAMGYYPKVGLSAIENGWIIKRTE